MGIMDFFRPAPVQQTQQTQQNNQPAPNGQPTPSNNQQTPPNGQSGNHNPSGATNTPVNPLDAYTKMYENVTKANPEVAPSFALDNETVGKVTDSLDFTKSVPAELMTKALAGDAQALIQAMNHVARGTYQTTLQHQSLLTDRFVGARLEHEGKQLGSRVKSELTTSALSSDANYNHPVVKAELNRVASLIQQANPDASPQQVALEAKKYLNDLNSALNPSKATTSPDQQQDFDWSKYLTQ